MKLITFTVPCYNSAEYMRKCVDSLLKGGDKVEIIIVNDGSSDDTGKIADEYKAAYPDIVKVIHQPNGGHGAGINAGLKIASGKYFKVVDSDDWLDTDAYLNLLYQAELAEEKGGVDLIVCQYYKILKCFSRKEDLLMGGDSFLQNKSVLNFAFCYTSHRDHQNERNSSSSSYLL